MNHPAFLFFQDESVSWCLPDRQCAAQSQLHQIFFDDQSLTHYLRQSCQSLQVQLLSISQTPPWHRDVCLIGDGVPWVLARTICDTPIEPAPWPVDRPAPLGDWLYDQGQCLSLEIAPVPVQYGGWSWARRRRFLKAGITLSVYEYFLTDFPLT